MDRLPSLTALRAFEAVARLQSMSRAADELFVTHGAISRQIQALEADVGFPLLRRLPHSVVPTDEGSRLAAALTAAFALIREGVTQLRPGPVVISCSASVMMCWLIPRLPTFKLAHPEIDLRFSAHHGTIDMTREGIDLAIRNDVVPVPKDIKVRRLMREWIGPVCTPEYAKATGINTAADIAKASLIATETRPNGWAEWQLAANAEVFDHTPSSVFEHFYMLLHATACGLGMGITPRLLVENDLESGRLVAPLGFVEGKRHLVIWRTPESRSRKDIALVERWLDEQVQISLNKTA